MDIFVEFKKVLGFILSRPPNQDRENMFFCFFFAINFSLLCIHPNRTQKTQPWLASSFSQIESSITTKWLLLFRWTVVAI